MVAREEVTELNTFCVRHPASRDWHIWTVQWQLRMADGDNEPNEPHIC